MKLEKWLNDAVRRLNDSGIATARLDSLVLLEDILGKDRTHLLARQDLELTNEQISELNKFIKRRALHEPLAYIRGKTEFYGHEFLVTPDTLEPRPETETMIDMIKKLRIESPFVADVGAGSGAIGITLALELPSSKVNMYEISEPAINIAKQNVKRLKVAGCYLYKNDLLDSVTDQFDIVVANLPYVPDDFTINEAAMQEPKIAIFGGADGLDLYRRLFKQIAKISQLPDFILTESLPFQHQKLERIAKNAGFKLIKTDDFIQLFSYLGSNQV